MRHDAGFVVERVRCAGVAAVERGETAFAETFQVRKGDVDALFLVACIDDLHDVAFRCLVVCGRGVELFMAFDGFSSFGEVQNMRASVRGIEHLDVPIDRADALEVVEPDEVGAPLPAVDVGEEGRIGGLMDYIGVAFEAGHECCFGKCGLEVVHGHSGLVAEPGNVGGIFACEDLWALAVVGVVTGGVVQEPFGRHVIVLVYEVDVEPVHLFPAIVEVFSACRRTRRAAYLDVGILCAEPFHKAFEPFGVKWSPLLVAYADLFEVEGSGMPHFGAKTSPFACDGTVGKVDEVECVVDVRLQVVHGNMGVLIVIGVLKLAGKAATQDRKRLGSDSFGKEEELVEA